MFRKFNPFTGEDREFPWLWFGIKVGIVTALIVWWLLDQKNKKLRQPAYTKDTFSPNRSIPLPDENLPLVDEPQQISPKPDDLRKIEGIGPKIQTTLQAAGIQTYAQLAAKKPADLKQILVDAGIRLGNPTTWPEQAALAAAEDWDQLKTLQRTLKGGLRE